MLFRSRALGSDGFVVQADVCKPDEIRRRFARVKSEFGSLDIFVNNARPEVPTFYEGPMSISLDMFDFAMDSQAKAFLVGVREAAPLMRDGGRIMAMVCPPTSEMPSHCSVRRKQTGLPARSSMWMEAHHSWMRTCRSKFSKSQPHRPTLLRSELRLRTGAAGAGALRGQNIRTRVEWPRARAACGRSCRSA